MADTLRNFDIDDLRFVKTTPLRLVMDDRWWQIQDLRTDDLRKVFSRRTDEEVEYLTDSLTSSSWSNPNRAVGRGLRTKQRYSWPRVVAAMDKKEQKIVGYAYGADNASSQRDGIRGLAERFAKLHVPLSRFEAARYFWLREVVPMEGDRQGLVTVLGALLLKGCKANQPVTCYPWSEEHKLRNNLLEWGLDSDGNGPEQIFAFGDDKKPAMQWRWIAPSAGQVIQNIISIPGAAEAIRQAENS